MRLWLLNKFFLLFWVLEKLSNKYASHRNCILYGMQVSAALALETEKRLAYLGAFAKRAREMAKLAANRINHVLI